MPPTSQSDRDRIRDFFSDLPKLDFSKVKDSKFVTPGLAINPVVRDRNIGLMNTNRASIASQPRRTFYNDLDTLPPDKPSGMHSVNVVQEAIDKASGKLEYGRTPLDEWQQRLVYTDDVAVRDGRGIWDIRRSQLTDWQAGQPINTSADVADNWFRTELISGIVAGRFVQGLIVYGGAGTGKSTVLKHLILKHFSILKQENVVFSRFELMKFWDRIESAPQKKFKAEARKYMAVIHARDLLLHRFCMLTHMGRFQVDSSPSSFYSVGSAAPKSVFDTKLRAFLDELTDEYDLHDIAVKPIALDRIWAAVSRIADPTLSLFTVLDQLPLRDLHIMIFVLAHNKKLVTVYDGLDAVRPEDVLSTTPDGTALWECACKVMELRNVLGDFDQVVKDAPRLNRQSILVTRNNTLQGLVNRKKRWADTVTKLAKYQIAPVAVMPAAISTARAVIAYIPEFHTRPPDNKNTLASQLLRPFVRSMDQIFHSRPDDDQTNAVEDLFDGNLRKLFRLLSLSLRWTSNEMLSGKHLDSEDYNKSAEHLLSILSSTRGIEFLRQKSYRAVETLLIGGAGWFENAVAVRRQQVPGTDDVHVSIEANDGHHGVLDNVLNYDNLDDAASIEGHMLIEKVRYLQVLQSPKGFRDFRGILSDQFGYPSDMEVVWKKLMFLMKTGFVNVEIAPSSGGTFMIATSRRGLLALSLLKNLGYIENIFHQSLFPASLVGHIADVPRRDASTTVWSARSIRNAYVFLTYFNCLENNPLRGQRVPAQYRLFDWIKAGLLHSIEAMANPTAMGEDDLANKAEIARMAVEEITLTREYWRAKRLI